MLDSLNRPLVIPSPPSHSAGRRLAVTTAFFFLAATAVSAAGSWIPSFWGDEAASLMSAQRPLPTLFTMLGNVDAVHGTYYLFLHFWIDAFGASPFSVRLPSAFAVGIAAAGVVLLANRLSGYRAAVFAGAVAVFLPRLTLVGEETRSYAASAACAIWLTYLLVTLIDRNERRVVGWWAYSALFALSLYVFAYSGLIGLAHAAILLVGSRSTRALIRPWSIAAGIGVMAALPVLYWGYAERAQIAYLNTQSTADFFTVFIGQWFGDAAYAALAWAAILGILVALIVDARRVRGRVPGSPAGRAAANRHRIVMVSSMVAFVPVAALLTVNLVTAVYTNRYLAMSAPAVALLIGYALSRLPRRWGVIALVVLTVAAVPSYTTQREPFAKNQSDWAQAAQIVQQHASAGDAIVFDESTRPSRRLRLALHSYPDAFRGLVDPTLKVPYAQNTWWWDTTNKPADVPHRFDGVQRVWLLEYKEVGKGPNSYGMADLRALGFQKARSYDGHRSVVFEFVRAGSVSP